MSITRLVTALVGLCFLMGVESRAHYENPLGIVGGDLVNITEAPFMAHYRPLGYTHFCGATIIHQSFLISAASCHYMMERKKLLPYITVGTDKANSGGEEYEIDCIYPHPGYVNHEFDNDIVLIQLRKPLKFSETVQAIPLAEKNVGIPEGAEFETLGFGEYTPLVDYYSDELLKVSIPYVNHEECEILYEYPFSDRIICAGTKDKGNCRLDIGGPLIYNGTLLGVVSFTSFPYPSLYTYIPAFRDFIDHVIAKYS